MNELKPHQQRVVEEKAALDEKINKLEAFLAGEVFQTLDFPEKSRLRHQLSVMGDYSEVLKQRISAF